MSLDFVRTTATLTLDVEKEQGQIKGFFTLSSFRFIYTWLLYFRKCHEWSAAPACSHRSHVAIFVVN